MKVNRESIGNNMFGMVDLLVASAIEERLEFLSRHPDHLEFLLCPLTSNAQIRKKVGAEYITQCIDFVTKNRINVVPFYAIEMEKIPTISVIYQGVENQKFIGDYGAQQIMPQIEPRTIYARWDVKAIADDVLEVPVDYKLEQKIWPNIYVTCGTFTTVLKGIEVGDETKPTKLYLAEAVPSGTSLKGWGAISGMVHKGYNLNASMDAVTVQCMLTTNGDPGIHRLLQLVLRYCLKSSRMYFESNGFYNTEISYNAPIVADPNMVIYESTATINGQYNEHWIFNEFYTPDPASKISICLTATNDTTPEAEVRLL